VTRSRASAGRRAALWAAGACVGLLAAELGLRSAPEGALFNIDVIRPWHQTGKLLERHARPPALKSAGTRLALSLGDSVTARPYFARTLERELAAFGDYAVWSRSVPGFNVDDYARTLEELKGERFDLVLVNFCVNDLSPSYIAFDGPEGRLHLADPYWGTGRTVRPDLYERIHLYRLWAYWAGKWMRGELRDEPKPASELTAERLRRLADLLRATGKPFLGVLYPSLEPMSKSKSRAFWAAARESGIPVLDLHEAEAFAGHDAAALRRFKTAPHDWVHYNEAGMDAVIPLIAREIAALTRPGRN
jgi:lysophospholipase L1-like esterase